MNVVEQGPSLPPELRNPLTIFTDELPGRAISVFDGYSMAAGGIDPIVKTTFLEKKFRAEYGGLDMVRNWLTVHNENTLTAERLASRPGFSMPEEELNNELPAPNLLMGLDNEGRLTPIFDLSPARQKLLEDRFREGLETILFSLVMPEPELVRQNDFKLANQLEFMQDALRTIGYNPGDPRRMEIVAENSYENTKMLISASSKSPQARRRSLKTLAGRFSGNSYLTLGLQKAAIDISGVQNGHSTMTSGGDTHDAFVQGGATGLDFVISYLESIR